MIDLREYEGLALETGAFKDIELVILKEAFAAWRLKPGDPYTILEIRDGRVLAGFAVACRQASTDFSFDLRALCVDPAYVGTGVASSLLGMLEEELRNKEASAILRVETSTRKEAAVGTGVLTERGYALMGHIPDFYEAGDDYYMYAKHLREAPAAPASEGKEAS
jgi:ribosomal protein S18 acetylase RimI-like enzyme